MSEPMESNRRVAYHEAGHAVVAWCVDMGISHVSVKLEGDHRGYTTTEDHSTIGADSHGNRPRGAAAGSLFWAAGSAAERIQFNDCNPTPALYDKTPIDPKIRAQVPAIVERILRAHWPAVQALADHLIQPPIDMPGQRAMAIVQAALPAPPWSDDEWFRLLDSLDALITGGGSSTAP
jgi:hypothetical protein